MVAGRQAGRHRQAGWVAAWVTVMSAGVGLDRSQEEGKNLNPHPLYKV